MICCESFPGMVFVHISIVMNPDSNEWISDHKLSCTAAANKIHSIPMIYECDLSAYFIVLHLHIFCACKVLFNPQYMSRRVTVVNLSVPCRRIQGGGFWGSMEPPFWLVLVLSGIDFVLQWTPPPS